MPAGITETWDQVEVVLTAGSLASVSELAVLNGANAALIGDELAFTYTGRSLKPFAPVHVTGLRDGSGNLTISWMRRSRVDAEWRDGKF